MRPPRSVPRPPPSQSTPSASRTQLGQGGGARLAGIFRVELDHGQPCRQVACWPRDVRCALEVLAPRATRCVGFMRLCSADEGFSLSPQGCGFRSRRKSQTSHGGSQWRVCGGGFARGGVGCRFLGGSFCHPFSRLCSSGGGPEPAPAWERRSLWPCSFWGWAPTPARLLERTTLRTR
jgi:hypothetical protein